MFTKYEVISPDGFPIDFEIRYYDSFKEAEEAFEKWKERYSRQGYYSSNGGRIPLEDLKSHCKIGEA